MSCSRCHVERSALLGTVNSFMMAEETASKLLGREWKPGLRVDNETCLTCHDLDETVLASGIRMSHAEVLDAGFRCTDCHDRSGHRVSAVPMSRCTSCHNGSDAAATCETCHAERGDQKQARKHDPEWSVTHGATWEKTHGMGDLAGCGACHEPEKCAKCHDTALPHPEQFGSTHGEQARESRESCLTCHRKTFCDNCHGMNMPHPAGFLRGHSKVVSETGADPCDRCHVSSQCGECHDKHTHPGRPQRTRAPQRMYQDE